MNIRKQNKTLFLDIFKPNTSGRAILRVRKKRKPHDKLIFIQSQIKRWKEIDR